METPYYQRPDWFTGNVANRIVAWLTRRGVSVWGSRVLFVRGRTSGQWRSNPVNLLDHAGHRYLVAPRGETDWVRNLRAAGGGELRLGRRVEAFTAVELSGDEKIAVLREYLRRWKWEVGTFFGGVGADSTHAELAAIAGRHPVFVVGVSPREPGR